MYIYRTEIYRDLNFICGINESENNSKKSCFESNYLANCLLIDEVIFNDDNFIIEKSYSDFKLLVDGTIITWGDVKVIARADKYVLHILSPNPL